MSRPRPSPRLRLEPLESRRLLAGNVTVRLDSGSLVVQGDRRDNAIAIGAGAEDGELTIVGLGDANGQPTTINQAATPLTLSGLTKDLVINLGKGNDWVGLTNLVLPRNLRINSGGGHDRIGIGGIPAATSGNPLSARSLGAAARADSENEEPGDEILEDERPGDDVIYTLAGAAEPFVPLGTLAAGPVRVEGDVLVVSGAGDDELGEAALNVRGGQAILTGAGKDEVEITESAPTGEGFSPGVRVNHRLTVDLGAGNDIFTAFAGDNTAGDDDPALRVENDLIVVGGAEKDFITLESVRISDRLIVLGGAGNDSLTLDNARAASAILATGSGHDVVEILNSDLNGLQAALGLGNDTVRIGASQIDNDAVVDGVQGDDRFEDLGGNTIADLRRRRIDHVA